MQPSPLRTTLVATFTTVFLLFATWIFLRPDGHLLSYANFEYEVISPNADNIYDVTRVTYKLSQPANVSIFFWTMMANAMISAPINHVSLASTIYFSPE